MLEDIHTCNLDYVMQILYVIESRQNTKTNMEQKMQQTLPFICSYRIYKTNPHNIYEWKVVYRQELTTFSQNYSTEKSNLLNTCYIFRFDQWNILLVFKMYSYLRFMLVCLKSMSFWWYNGFFFLIKTSILVVYYIMRQIITFS